MITGSLASQAPFPLHVFGKSWAGHQGWRVAWQVVIVYHAVAAVANAGTQRAIAKTGNPHAKRHATARIPVPRPSTSTELL